jgi:hypothetical protein
MLSPKRSSVALPAGTRLLPGPDIGFAVAAVSLARRGFRLGQVFFTFERNGVIVFWFIQSFPGRRR